MVYAAMVWPKPCLPFAYFVVRFQQLTLFPFYRSNSYRMLCLRCLIALSLGSSPEQFGLFRVGDAEKNNLPSTDFHSEAPINGPSSLFCQPSVSPLTCILIRWRPCSAATSSGSRLSSTSRSRSGTTMASTCEGV